MGIRPLILALAIVLSLLPGASAAPRAVFYNATTGAVDFPLNSFQLKVPTYGGLFNLSSSGLCDLGDFGALHNGTFVEVNDPTQTILLNATTVKFGADPIVATRAKKKNNNDSRTLNTAVVADSELVIPIGANQVWTFEFHVFVGSSSTTPGWKGGLTFPSSPTDVRWTMDYHDYDGLTITPKGLFTGDSTTTTCTFFSTTNGGEVIMRGQIRNGANSGNITLMYAQAVSNAASTLNKTRSYATAWLVP